jgi:mRNA interferase MazF
MARRGDVVLALFPNSDLISAKIRPALVVQADDLGTDVDQVIVAMITSRIFRAGHPSRVSISRSSLEGERSGLMEDSVIMTDVLATVASKQVYRVVGRLPMTEVDAALRYTLHL